MYSETLQNIILLNTSLNLLREAAMKYADHMVNIDLNCFKLANLKCNIRETLIIKDCYI